MKLFEIAISILLIPALIAGPPNRPQLSGTEKALLKKPQYGSAEIAWRDRTHMSANILRVTDSFISIQDRTAWTCQNVELGRIADIKWEKWERPSHDSDNLHIPLWSVPLDLIVLPVAAAVQLFTAPAEGNSWAFVGLLGLLAVAEVFDLPVEAGRHLFHHDGKADSWEATNRQPNQSIERIEFDDRQARTQIVKQVVAVRTGHYRFEDGTLYTRYDDGGTETAVAAHFDCDQLVFDTPTKLQLRVHPGHDRAGAPIVGRWWNDRRIPGPDVWEFRPDGTFQTERVQEFASGEYKKSGESFDVQWRSPRPSQEAWHVSRASGVLRIVHGIETTEYQRRPAFD